MLSQLTDANAVRRAIAEYEELGRDEFLRKYGYERSRRYFLQADGHEYDSKAIVGAAFGFQHPDRGPLKPNDFSGGDATVRTTLERLGFEVTARADNRAEDGSSIGEFLDAVCDLLHGREHGAPQFSSKDLDQLIQQSLPSRLQQEVGERVVISGRTAIGTPADVPWVGLFPSDQDRSAQRGYYLVYLFAKDGSAAFLSLNPIAQSRNGGSERGS